MVSSFNILPTPTCSPSGTANSSSSGKMGKLREMFGRSKKGSMKQSPSNTTSSFVSSNPFGNNPSSSTGRPGRLDTTEVAPPPSYAEATNPNALTVPALASNARRNASPSPSVASAVTIESVLRDDDPYAYLRTFDTVFLIDDSSSMSGRRWNEVRALLGAITPICTSHDSDGIDIFFLNHKTTDRSREPGKASNGYRNITSSRRVDQIFNSVAPRGVTPIGKTLTRILAPYTMYYEEQAKAAEQRGDFEVPVKPMNIIVITDGRPTDEPEGEITRWAQRLDKVDAPAYQVGIQFFQVGNDYGAAEYLRQLDDELASNGCVRDMVDTMTWDGAGSQALTADGILKAVLGGVVRRLDRRRMSQDEQRPNLGPRGRR